MTSIINEKGCLSAGEEWLEKNLLVVAGVAVGIAFLQVCSITRFFNWIQLILLIGAKYYLHTTFGCQTACISFYFRFHLQQISWKNFCKFSDIGNMLCAESPSRHFCSNGQVGLTSVIIPFNMKKLAKVANCKNIFLAGLQLLSEPAW